MKKFILLFMLVFGINTAVNAQTRLQFSDEKGTVIETLEFEKTLSKNEINTIIKDLSNTNQNNATYGGTFRLDIFIEYAPDHWAHEYGRMFRWYTNDTIESILYRIVKMYF
nr:hypothetical protein [uncultured Flavobacterium sp.]